MSVDFFFDPPTYSIPQLMGLRFKWADIPDPKVAEMIAQEDQYIEFHRFVLENTRFTAAGSLPDRPYTKGLGLSVRAGAIKAAILLCASIAEAALRAHAERRGYPLHSDPAKRTFGNVIRAWEQPAGRPRPEVASIWDSVKRLRDVRNNIHLFKAAADRTADFEEVLNEERNLLSGAQQVIDHLAALRST